MSSIMFTVLWVLSVLNLLMVIKSETYNIVNVASVLIAIIIILRLIKSQVNDDKLLYTTGSDSGTKSMKAPMDVTKIQLTDSYKIIINGTTFAHQPDFSGTTTISVTKGGTTMNVEVPTKDILGYVAEIVKQDQAVALWSADVPTTLVISDDHPALD